MYYLGTWMNASPTFAVTSNLKALDGCSSHHLQGRGHTVAAPLRSCSHNTKILETEGYTKMIFVKHTKTHSKLLADDVNLSSC